MTGLETAQTKFLLYHDLVTLTGGDAGLARERFRHQLSLMRLWGFTFRSMPEFLDGAARGPRDVVITFDDGGRSLLDCALPVLKEFSAPATMFVITGFVGRRGEKMDFLSWDDLDTVAAEGIDVGSHGSRHHPLIGTDGDEIRRDLAEAAATFARHGFAPRTFAYPYGRRSDAAKDAVRAAGFEAAFMIKQGGRDAFELRRRLFTLSEPDSLARFFMSDHYFGIRKTIVSLVPGRFRREFRPLPHEVIGGNAFGVDEAAATGEPR